MGNTFFVINPAGHGGTGLSTWEAFQARWPERVDPDDAVVTEHAGHARELAAGVEGYDTLAVVGGDGTVGDVATGILDREGSRPQLAIIPAGTGNDIGRNVGVFTLEEAVAALTDGQLRAFDLLKVEYQEDDGRGYHYAFLDVAVGFTAIEQIRPWMKRSLGPKGAYYLATLLELLVYRPPRMTVRADGEDRSARDTFMVIAGNVEYSAGGSMRIAPGARTDDGVVNVTIFPVKSKLKMITKLLPAVATGDHIKEPGVDYFPAKTLEIESEPPAIVELDGDLYGTTPATITVHPGGLQVVTPRS